MSSRPVKSIAIAGLALSAGLAALAGFIAPYDPAEQYREYALRPPMVEGQVRFFVRASEYRLAGLFPTNVHLFGVDEPGHVFLMGTDTFGRDQFSRFLQATQVSVSAACLSAALAVLIGGWLGMMAGYYRGWADDLIMRAGEVFVSLPWMYLVLAARAFLPLRFPASASFATIVLVPGILAWARMARVVRGAVLPLRDRGYVAAARGFGASDAYVMRKHLFPDILPVAATQATILIPRFIVAEVSLSFLGLGIDEPLASWGNMLGGVQQYHTLISHSWLLLPAVGPILVSFFCFLLVDEVVAARAEVAG